MGIATQARAFLWENGGPMIDLKTLIPADSALNVVSAERINDRGEIVGTGLPPGVSIHDFLLNESLGHVYLLIPDGEE